MIRRRVDRDLEPEWLGKASDPIRSFGASAPRNFAPVRSRLSAKLQAMLRESGEDAMLKNFGVEAWVDEWMRLPLPELNGKSPVQALRYAGGWASVVRVLEAMRSGACA